MGDLQGESSNEPTVSYEGDLPSRLRLIHALGAEGREARLASVYVLSLLTHFGRGFQQGHW